MTAAAIIERARADGVTLALDPAGKLRATGEPTAVARWLPEVRASKGALVNLLSAPDAEPRRLWLIVLQDGSRFSSSFCPPTTRQEVAAWYPGPRVEVEQDPGAAPRATAGPSLEPTAQAAPVMCCTCTHWVRDAVGDGSGLGRCAVTAPASLRPGSLWPRGELCCRDHREVTP